MARRTKLYEGRAKVLYEGPKPGTLVQYFKDESRAPHRVSRDLLNGRGVLNNRLSAYLMTGLGRVGVPTHFMKWLNMREQLVRSCEMVPLYALVRNVAAGSLVRRLGLDEGTPLPRPIVEYRLKSDDRENPLVTEEHIAAFGWVSQQDLDDILSLALRTNDVLSGLFYAVGVPLIDVRVSIGRVSQEDFQRLVVADDLGFDACRFGTLDQGGASAGADLLLEGSSPPLTDAQPPHSEVARRLGILPRGASPSRSSKSDHPKGAPAALP